MEGGETWRVFIDNKRWDALVSAWPTELDDRHAVYSHVTALLIRAPHERAHRATGRKDERQKRRCKESGSWGSGGCVKPAVPSVLFQLYTNTLFSLFRGTCISPAFQELTSISRCVHNFVS